MKFRQLSGQNGETVNENPAQRALVVNEMVVAAPILEVAEFYTHSGNADTPRKGAATVGGTTRTLNNDYTGNVATPTFGATALKIVGDKLLVDRAHQRRGQDIASVRLAELKNFAASLGRHFMDMFVNGDAVGTPAEFSGLKTQLVSNYLMTFNDAADGYPVILGNSDAAKKSQQLFRIWLDKMLDAVDGGANFILLDSEVAGYMRAIGMENVQAGNVTDIFNNQANVIGRYNNIPVFRAGYNKDKSAKVITKSETVGNSTDCTSIYAGHFAEGQDLSFATNVGLEVDDLGLVGSQYVTTVELDVDLVLLSAACAKRMQGIRLG